MGSISLNGVAKRFGATEVIPPLDLEIADDEFVVLHDGANIGDLTGDGGCGHHRRQGCRRAEMIREVHNVEAQIGELAHLVAQPFRRADGT